MWALGSIGSQSRQVIHSFGDGVRSVKVIDSKRKDHFAICSNASWNDGICEYRLERVLIQVIPRKIAGGSPRLNAK